MIEPTEYTFSNGERRTLRTLSSATILGLDPEGRVVVRFFPHHPPFALTLCCNAVDKGTEDGVVCRRCWGTEDVGVYDPEIAHPVVETQQRAF